jgi:hypothetical protein
MKSLLINLGAFVVLPQIAIDALKGTEVLYVTRSTPKDLPNLLEGTGLKIYFCSTEDLTIEVLQYSLQNSSGDCSGLIRDCVAMVLNSPGIDIPQLHPFPDLCSIP